MNRTPSRRGAASPPRGWQAHKRRRGVLHRALLGDVFAEAKMRWPSAATAAGTPTMRARSRNRVTAELTWYAFRRHLSYQVMRLAIKFSRSVDAVPSIPRPKRGGQEWRLHTTWCPIPEGSTPRKAVTVRSVVPRSTKRVVFLEIRGCSSASTPQLGPFDPNIAPRLGRNSRRYAMEGDRCGAQHEAVGRSQ